MWLKWLPWKYIVRRVAQAKGFIDPISTLSHLHRFAQPSEVAEPIELLRAGVVFHARGLMNTRAIQHNLDWVWPYWVERQFDPADPSFIPRAFSITHVNLTHRNWTAIGIPDVSEYPIVDPRGLLTPFYDSWSLDAWLLPSSGAPIFPSRIKDGVEQHLDIGSFQEPKRPMHVITTARQTNGTISTDASIQQTQNQAAIHWQVRATSPEPAKVVLALRPYNPEGVSFIHSIQPDSKDPESVLIVNEEERIHFADRPHTWIFSDYHTGDALQYIHNPIGTRDMECSVGLATACAVYDIAADTDFTTSVTIPAPAFQNVSKHRSHTTNLIDPTEQHTELELPDARFQFLTDAAQSSLVLFSPSSGEVVPGPYTYKRFWFRDAVLILHGLLCAGHTSRVAAALNTFPQRQLRNGYFRSQEGEWDSNGQVLWLYGRYRKLTGKELPEDWLESVRSGAEWILKKRLPDTAQPGLGGLLPAGFSAEHFGVNDYYYWDDFWAIAGLRAAADIFGADSKSGKRYAGAADDFETCVTRSIHFNREQRNLAGIPAAPFRRMDAGAIGSIVASYPLALTPEKDDDILATVSFLREKCFHAGGFFQDMIHSGINPYLTLHVAQVLLRAGHSDFFSLVQRTAELASSTGQWPEAIHPHTLGGCMGDGQHAWAAAEWFMMIRNMFVREEDNELILCSGVPSPWLVTNEEIRFGPTLTRFGPVTVYLQGGAKTISVKWNAPWSHPPARISIRLPDRPVVNCSPDEKELEIQLEAAA